MNNSKNLQPILQDARLLLRPLQESDFEALFEVAADPGLWDQHFEPTRHEFSVFRKFFDSAIASQGALVAIDQEGDQIIGTSRYDRHNPKNRDVEIGYTFLARRCWKTGMNTRMKILMLDHAFTFVDSVLFYVWEHNFRSKSAVKKLGAVEERLFDGPLHRSYEYRLRKNDWQMRARPES